MRVKNKKLFLKRFSLFLILAIVLFWPGFSKSQESVTLNSPAPGCLGSSAFVNLNWTSTITGNPTYFVLRKIQGEANYTEIASTANTFFSDNTIQSDKNYLYQIRAEKGAQVFFSNEVLVLAVYCPPVLSPPTTSCVVDGPHINLSWGSISGNLSTYEIYRDGTKIGQTLNTTFDDGPNLEGTKTYNYFIKAIWRDGNSTSSDVVPVTAPACPPILTATADCNSVSPGGPKVNLSWNSLLGVQNYQIYRKAQSEASFSLFQTITQTNYIDNLVESLPTYWQGGQISYYVKAVWTTDQKDSLVQTIDIPRCSPYLTVESNCDEFSFRLFWTATLGAIHYNIYRNGQFAVQNIGITKTSHIDGLSLDPASPTYCPNYQCTFNYYVDAINGGTFPSNSVEKSIDCATIIPPSPAPVLDPLQSYCVSGDSRIKISWTPSNNVTYYGVYRNGVNIFNLLETSYVDSGVESGYESTYYVVAYGKGGTNNTISENSQTIKAVSCLPPSTPTLSLTPGCETGQPFVNLSWTETTNTYSYEVWRGPLSNNLSLLITFDKTAPEFTTRTWPDTGVLPSATYYYKVVSKGPTGVPPTNSDLKTTVTLPCLPTTPVLTLDKACESGNPVVNLSWATDAANTHHFEIFRTGWSTSVPIYDTSVRSYKDNSVVPDAHYNYKVEAVGYGDPPARATEGYKSITTYNCAPPGPFTLTEPTVYCQGSYPKSEISWTNSTNATSYDLYRNRLNPDDSIAQTIILPNVNSPYTERGFANALSFDGSNDYVNAPAPTQWSGNTPFIIEFWMKYSIQPSRQWIMDIGNRSNPSYRTVHFLINSNYMTQFGFWDGVQNQFNISAYEGKWTHVVTVYNPSTSLLTTYLNGVKIDEDSVPAGSVNLQPVNTYIGLRTGSESYFKGFIDQVRIYNQGLNSTEIVEHFNGIYTNESGLVGLWHFDEGSGQTVSDGSNYGNNGRLGSTTGIDTNDPTWIQNGIQSQTKYSWQVRASGPGGSTLSNTTNSNIIPLCPPTKPGLVLTPLCEAGTGLPAVTLRWSYTINTTRYEIYRQDKGLIGTVVQTVDPTGRNFTDNNDGEGLNETTSYTYYVKAIGGGGENQSDSILVTTLSCLKPSQPQILTINFACGGTGNSYPRVNLSWSTSTNATSYTLYRSPPVPPLSVTTALTSYTDTAVTVNTTYSYYVIAYGPGGASPASDATSTTTGYCPPSTPSITSLTTGCETNNPVNTISWSDATTFNTFEYRIYRNTVNSPLATPIMTIASTTPAFTSRTWKDNLSLSPLTTYYYWVKAAGPAGESAYSSSRSIPTYSCQPPPAPNLNFEDRCTNSNKPITVLTWNKTFETTQHQLYKNGVNFKNFTPSSGYYFRDWLLIGPFSYTWDGAGIGGSTYVAFNNDYIGGELIVKPRAGESTGGKTWFEYKSTGDLINFNNIFWPNDYVISYAFAYVYSPINQTAQLRVGSDDGVKVFLNGSQIWSNYVWRGASPDKDKININLSAGINTLLIKVQEGGSAWGFYARITNTAGNDILGNITNWDSSAVTGVSANYYVLSIGLGGTSTPSNIVTSNPLNCLPAKPDLVVTPQCDVTNPQLKLSWQADPNTLYWSIYKGREGQSPTSLTDTTLTSFIDGNIESGVNYTYFVVGRGKEVDTFSDALTEKAPFCYNPPYGGSPFSISATPICFGYSSRIKVEWPQDPTGNTISYSIWRKNISADETDFSTLTTGLAATVIQYLDYDIIEENTYQYKVEAVGSGQSNSLFSIPSNTTTSYACSKLPPFPPVLSLNLVYSVDHKIEVSIGWTDAGNEEEYKVFRRLAGESEFAKANQRWWRKLFGFLFGKISFAAYESPLATLEADVLNYTDYTVTDGITYEYQVVASNINGDTLSNIISVPVPIARPGDFTLSGSWLGTDKIHLTWTEALTTEAGGIVSYKVLRDTTANFDSPTVICSDITVPPLECYDNNPPLLLRIYYKAVANNNGGSTDSNILTLSFLSPLWKEIAPW